MALAPGDRIEIKKRIAETLGQQSWRDIDLTLAEFGLNTSDQWSGNDQSAYVLEMLQWSAPGDDELRALDDYLHPRTAPAERPPQAFAEPSTPWTGSGFRLFLSHVHQYERHAGELREALAQRSIDAFVAHDSIEPTADWLSVIERALDTCDGCVALLTPGFRESDWTDQEVGYCMARRVLVIPVEFGLMPYGFLGRYQAYPVKKAGTTAGIALGIFDLLVEKEQSRSAMARALVERFVRTSSYNGARENFTLLRTIPAEAWTQSLVDAVWEAQHRNGEIRDASINWQSSERALRSLFKGLPFTRPSRPEDEDDPF